MEQQRLTRARSFDQVADQYDRCRPTYPEEIFGDLHNQLFLGEGASILEIGCGTGQASKSIAKWGTTLTCLEPGCALSEYARQNLAPFSNAQVKSTSFETFDAHPAFFDAIVAFTSWHWLDPATKYQMASKLLKPTGNLVIVWSGHGFPEGFDPLFAELQVAYEAIREPGESIFNWPPPSPDDVPDLRDEIEETGLFEVASVRRYLWTTTYNADAYVELLGTYSDHLTMRAEKRERLFHLTRELINRRTIGMLSKDNLAIVHVARKIPGVMG